MSYADEDAEVDRVVIAYVRDRQWLRCSSCGFVADASELGDLEMVVRTDGGAVVGVLCLDCSETEDDDAPEGRHPGRAP